MSEKRLRNTDTVLLFPLIDYTTGEYYTGTWAGLTNATIEAYHWSDGVAPQALSIAATPEQLGSTGLWQLALTASELNIASQYVIIKFDADELAAQGVTVDLVDSLIETVAGQIKAKTDLIPASPANESTLSTGIEALLNAIADCLQAADYTAPDDTAVRADIAALNNISVTDITGSTTFKQLLAAAKGRFTKSGNAYTFYDTDGTTALFTLTISDTGRTVS